ISNTDSIPLAYATAHIRVKVYSGRGPDIGFSRGVVCSTPVTGQRLGKIRNPLPNDGRLAYIILARSFPHKWMLWAIERWVSPVNGGNPDRVYEFPDPDVRIDYPVGSPDGKWVLFDRFRPQGGEIWAMNGVE